MTAPTDAELATAAAGGDRDAFAAIVARYRDEVRRVVGRHVPGRDDVEDGTQTAFLNALAAMRTYDAARPLRPWLRAIARNAALDLSRRTSRSRASDALDETPDDAPSPELCAIRGETAGLIGDALATLPDRQRLVLRLLFFERLRYRDIAERLELPLGTVKTHVFRAKAALAPLLANVTPGA